jgi:hypothetical protein
MKLLSLYLIAMDIQESTLEITLFSLRSLARPVDKLAFSCVIYE